VLALNGTLYGTTFQGGPEELGTVFSITADGAEHVVYFFQTGGDGTNPFGHLTDVNGTLYGTTVYGGGTDCPNGCGTVFSLRPWSE
jgi:uncharacterized repeat protein (TIGR03803 family)